MVKDFKKNVFLEQKVLEFNLGNRHKALEVYELISGLKPEGFEIYVIKYFDKFGLKLEHVGRNNEGDGGIDGKGDGVYLQCKKYHRSKDFTSSIGISFVRDFFGAIIDDYNTHENGKEEKYIPDSYFVATVNYTEEAKVFARRNNMSLLDYNDVYDMLSLFPLSEFKSSLNEKEKQKYFSSYQTSLKEYSLEELSPEDIYFYYREVRKSIALRRLKTDKQNGYIFSNSTLRSFSSEGVLDITNFKKVRKGLNFAEKKKLCTYEKELEFAIRILQN